MKGNPIASMRFRWQTYTKDTDEPMESEWEQLKSDAVKHGKNYLKWHYKKFGSDDMVVKVFNEMNRNQMPIVITLKDALVVLK